MLLMGILFIQILIMFAYILGGWLLIKTKLLDREGARQMSKILLYIITPVVVINAYTHMPFSKENTLALLIAFLLSAIALLLSIIVSRIVFNKNYKIERFGTAFSNAGFMGVPLVMAVVGNEGIFYISAFIALISVLQWTYGVYAITDSKDVISFKKIMTNPIVISLFTGIAVYVLGGLGFVMPSVILDQMAKLSGILGPLAMMILGTYVARLSLKDFIGNTSVYLSTFFRLVIIPIMTLLIFSFLPKNYETIALVILIVSSAPVGINTAIFAELYQIDNKRAVVSVGFSTLLSIFSMPLIVLLSTIFW